MADDLHTFERQVREAIEAAAQADAAGDRTAQRLLAFIMRGRGTEGEQKPDPAPPDADASER